jgi:hypothetical protein
MTIPAGSGQNRCRHTDSPRNEGQKDASGRMATDRAFDRQTKIPVGKTAKALFDWLNLHAAAFFTSCPQGDGRADRPS